MSRMISIAAGQARGYFIYQSFIGNNRKSIHRRLHKSSTEKNCRSAGDIAEYPTIIRMVWVMLACGWETGVLLYFIFAMGTGRKIM